MGRRRLDAVVARSLMVEASFLRSVIEDSGIVHGQEFHADLQPKFGTSQLPSNHLYLGLHFGFSFPWQDLQHHSYFQRQDSYQLAAQTTPK